MFLRREESISIVTSNVHATRSFSLKKFFYLNQSVCLGLNYKEMLHKEWKNHVVDTLPARKLLDFSLFSTALEFLSIPMQNIMQPLV